MQKCALLPTELKSRFSCLDLVKTCSHCFLPLFCTNAFCVNQSPSSIQLVGGTLHGERETDLIAIATNRIPLRLDSIGRISWW